MTVYELWRQTYPRDHSLYDHLGVIYRNLGNLEKALEAAREAVRLEPNSACQLRGPRCRLHESQPAG